MAFWMATKRTKTSGMGNYHDKLPNCAQNYQICEHEQRQMWAPQIQILCQREAAADLPREQQIFGPRVEGLE